MMNFIRQKDKINYADERNFWSSQSHNYVFFKAAISRFDLK